MTRSCTTELPMTELPLTELPLTDPRATAVRRGAVARIAAAAFALACLAPAAFAQSAAKPVTAATAPAATAKATFAGGCFWCVEADFDKVPGVLSTTAGYTGGTTRNPTYDQVTSKNTGHAEVVEIVFDPSKVSYETLLTTFWRSIDPTVKDRQFCDVGAPYRTAIFTHDAAQLEAARRSLQALEKNKPFKDPIVTQIQAAGPFWKAEEYHQDYYVKNPLRYKYYRTSCGRDARLAELWGKP